MDCRSLFGEIGYLNRGLMAHKEVITKHSRKIGMLGFVVVTLTIAVSANKVKIDMLERRIEKLENPEKTEQEGEK